jgi:hypothetical protein
MTTKVVAECERGVRRPNAAARSAIDRIQRSSISTLAGIAKVL